MNIPEQDSEGDSGRYLDNTEQNCTCPFLSFYQEETKAQSS